MSEGTRLPLAEASEIAEDLVALLLPSCERLEVCGSIRRQAPTVGDIDIVAIPRGEPIEDMFGETSALADVLSHTLNELCGQQVIRQARRADGAVQGWGPRLKHAVYQGLKVQVQSVDPECLGMWMVVRTGPEQFSKWIVTARSAGGGRPPGIEVRDGFRLYRHGGLVTNPDEQSVFDTYGLAYIPATDREYFAQRMVK